MNLEDLLKKLDKIEDQKRALLNEACQDRELWAKYREYVINLFEGNTTCKESQSSVEEKAS